MARKDDIFMNFITHDLITEKYDIKEGELPKNLNDGLKSTHTIFKAIALIVDHTEAAKPSSKKAIYGDLTKFLNTSI